MVIMIRFAARVAAFLGNINLAADDRFNVARFGGFVKFRRSKKVPVICDGNRRHSIGYSLFDQGRDLASAVEQAVVGVQMQMNELISRHGWMIAETFLSRKKQAFSER